MENFDLTKMTDEQLEKLQVKIVREQADRKEKRKVDVVNAFEKAWRDLEEAGIKIWFCGNEYTTEEDFQLKLNEIYFDG